MTFKAHITREHVPDLPYQSDKIEIHGGAKHDENLLDGFFELLAGRLSLYSGELIRVDEIANQELVDGCGFWNIVIRTAVGTQMKYQCWVYPGSSAGFQVATIVD